MEIILNERKYIEEVLAGNRKPEELSIKKFIKLLAYYNRNVLELSTKKNADKIIETAARCYPEFSITGFSQVIDHYVNMSKTKRLIEIESIPVTEREFKIIRSLYSVACERVLFTMLVYAKYNNLLRSIDGNWTNIPLKTVWKVSRVTGSNDEKYEIVRKLLKKKLITQSRNSSSNNFKVNIVDNSSPIVLEITDMRELGLQYLRFVGRQIDKNIKICRKCGIHYRALSSNQLYCKKCTTPPDGNKVIYCEDCGQSIIVRLGDNHTTRCNECNDKYQRELKRRRMERYRAKKELVDATFKKSTLDKASI